LKTKQTLLTDSIIVIPKGLELPNFCNYYFTIENCLLAFSLVCDLKFVVLESAISPFPYLCNVKVIM